MSTRTSSLLIAAAFAAAAFTLGAQAADRDDGGKERHAANGQSIQSAQAEQPKEEESAAAKPARTLDSHWWEDERALDDGYVWPLPSAVRLEEQRRLMR